MRQKIVAGNWKMNKSYYEAVSLFSHILEFEDEFPSNVKVIVSPPYIYLNEFSAKQKEGRNISIAAQNCSHEQSGAFTGEVSAEMLKSIGINYCIIGHSERRALFGESNQLLKKKIDATLKIGIRPIFCCGESLDERNTGLHFKTVLKQIEEALFHLNEEAFLNVVIAYEPVWAIGTGVTATPEQAQEMHAFIRKEIENKFNKNIASQISILYGGSCNPENAKDIFACADVDGGLIGGASLKSNSFLKIIKEAGNH